MNRILITLIAAVVWALPGSAQLTIEECHRLAREHYPLTGQYDLIAASSEYTLQNLTHTWLPQATLGAQATWQNAVPAFPGEMTSLLSAGGLDMKGLGKTQYRVSLDVSQRIYDGGKSSAERQLTRSQDAEQRAQTDVDLYALNKRVDDLFFGIILMDERIEQTLLTLAMLEGNYDKLSSHVRNGAATAADASLLRAEIETLRQTKTNMEWSRTAYRHMLEIFIGTEIGDRKLVKPEAVEPASVVVRRPELQLIDAKLGTLAARERQVKNAVLPTVSAFGQVFYGYPGYNNFEAMMSRDLSWNAMVGVRMAWNISALYDRKNNLSRVGVQRRQLELQRDAFLFNNSLEVSRDNDEIQRLRQIIGSDATIVELRQHVRTAEESKLRNGVIDIHALVEKITDENVARQSQIIHRIELLKTIYDLKNTVNQ